MITRLLTNKNRANETYDGFATTPRGPRLLWPVRIASLTIMVSIAALINQVEIMAAIALVGLSIALWLLYFRNLWHRREQRFRALVQRSSHLTLLIEPDGSILFASPASQEMLGLRPEELAGRRNLLELTDSDNYSYVDEFLRDAAAEDHRSTSWELRLLHADGTMRDVAVDAANCRRDKQLGGILIDLYDVTERSAAGQTTRRQAYYDELTGLPNRELLTDRIQQTMARAGRSGEQFAVAMIDLDRFRVVNEGLGREAGDRLLVTVAQRLARTIRPGDTLARLGGDEFAVLLEGVTLPGQAAVVMERFVEALNEPIVIGLSGAGASYSSLGNLSLLRISTVRLAPELVARLDNSRAAAAVRAIIVLAHGLGAEVVAEGVSSDDQMEELRQLGCDRARGTFFSEALALTSLARGLGSDDDLSLAA